MAAVAARIPIFPANPLAKAPNKKAIDTSKPRSSFVWPPANNKPATTKTNIIKILYSAFKNAIAPDWILFPILATVSFSTFLPDNCLYSKNAIPNPNNEIITPNSPTSKGNSSSSKSFHLLHPQQCCILMNSIL